MKQTVCAYRPYVIEIYARIMHKRANRQLKWLFPRVLRADKRTINASPLSMERVLAALLFAAVLFAACVNNSSADNPFP